jgi:P-type E1-E2 ATPase
MVSLEMVKFMQGLIINKDKHMKSESTGISAHVNSSNLNEELGEISYIFSDKTGTLT